MTERCEWNPKHKCPAFDPPDEGDCEAQAVVRVGAYHLCQQCSSLPEFSKYKKRDLLRAHPLYVGSVNGSPPP